MQSRSCVCPSAHPAPLSLPARPQCPKSHNQSFSLQRRLRAQKPTLEEKDQSWLRREGMMPGTGREGRARERLEGPGSHTEKGEVLLPFGSGRQRNEANTEIQHSPVEDKVLSCLGVSPRSALASRVAGATRPCDPPLPLHWTGVPTSAEAALYPVLRASAALGVCTITTCPVTAPGPRLLTQPGPHGGGSFCVDIYLKSSKRISPKFQMWAKKEFERVELAIPVAAHGGLQDTTGLCGGPRRRAPILLTREGSPGSAVPTLQGRFGSAARMLMRVQAARSSLVSQPVSGAPT